MRRLILALVLLLIALPAWAVPAFDAASNPTPSFDWTIGAASVTWAHTVTGTNPVICVGSMGQTVTSVTYNTVNLSKQWEIDVNGAGLWNSFWCLLNPATGAHNVVITYSVSGGYSLGAVSYSATGSLGTPATAGPTTSQFPSVVVTSATGQLVIDGMTTDCTGCNAAAADGGQTIRNQVHDGVTGRDVNISEKAGAASVTMGWTLTSSFPWGTGGVALIPPASGAVRHRAIQTQ